MPKRNKSKDGTIVHLGIRVPLELKDALDKLATAGHRRISDEARLALENHVKAHTAQQ